MPRGCAFWRRIQRLVGPVAPVIRGATWAVALLIIALSPVAGRAETASPAGAAASSAPPPASIGDKATGKDEVGTKAPAASDGGTNSPRQNDAAKPSAETNKPATSGPADNASAKPGPVEPDATKPDATKPDAAKAATAKPVKAAHPQTLCLTVEAAAQANNLPVTFFARVIWQESRFNAKAVGPLTRNGGRAQGIAQFMPRTAEEKGLLDPFDPVQALPKSAEYLRELANEFGNLGLAAAAYNAGPRRVQEWLAGSGGMPFETRNYVFAITGASVEDWAQRADKIKISDAGAKTCSQLVALLKQAPNRFVDSLERRLSSAVLRPWGVQLSAGFSRARLMRAYATAERKFGSLIAGHDLNVFSLRLRSRGTLPFYQLRIGTDTWQQAIRLCDKIRKVGGACITLKNTGHAI
jgi:hypothetical protein